MEKIFVYQHSPAFSLPSFDPFCNSIHVIYLFIYNLSYIYYFYKKAFTTFSNIENISFINTDNSRINPKQKLPLVYYKDQFITYDKIFPFLHSLGYDLDHHLSEEDKSKSFSIQCLIEEKLYSYMLYYWLKDDNYQNITKGLFSRSFSFPTNYIQSFLAKYSMEYKIYSNHFCDDNEVSLSADKIYSHLSILLGDKDYFFGEQPTTIDSIIIGHLLVHYYTPLNDITLRKLIQKYPNIVKYISRISKILFNDNIPDFDVLKTKAELAQKDDRSLWNKVLIAGGISVCLWIYATNKYNPKGIAL